MQRVPIRFLGLVPALLSAAAVGAIYLPGALRRSAWSDDIPWLEYTEFPICYAIGRPVCAVGYKILFPVTVDGLVLLRVLGVAGIALLAAVMVSCLVNWGVPAGRATLWVVAAVLLPSFHSYAGWGAAFMMPWTAVLGFLSGLLWLKADSRKSGVWRALAIAVLVLSLLSYPPSAMFCWVYLGLRVLVLRTRPKLVLKQVLSMTWLLLVAGMGFVLIASALRLVKGIPVSYRFRTLSSAPEVFEKLVWFVSHPVVVAARPFLIDSPSNTSALLTGGPILVLVVIGLASRSSGRPVERLASLCLYATILSLTMFTHLVGVENQLEYRFMAGISIIMFAYISAAGVEIVRVASLSCLNLSQRTTGRLVTVSSLLVLILLVPFAALRATQNIDRVFIKPYNDKEKYVQEALLGFDLDLHNRIVAISDPSFYPSRQHLGVYSTVNDLSHPWVPAPMIRLVLREIYEVHDTIKVDVVAREDTNLDSTDYVVDFRPFAQALKD
jgi:hypothetical protein